MYIEFNYLKNFTCAAENCVNTCCSGWDIHIDEKTLNTITETNNNDVKRFFSKKIKPSSNKNFPAQIAIDKKKRCTFLDSNNLCKIQKKIDQRYLSHTCKTYPRREVLFPEVKFLSGSFGCPEITNISLFSEKLLSFKINNTKKTDQPIKLIDEKKFNSFDPEIKLKADLVLLAMGFLHPKKDKLINDLGLELDNRGNVAANDVDYKTNKDKIFVSGDMRRGQSLVVWAIREGRQVAHSVDKFLMGKSNLPF